jgi:hypothetical protein
MIPAHQLGAIKVAEQQKPLDPICEMTPEGPSLALDQLTGVSFSQDGPLHPGNSSSGAEAPVVAMVGAADL